MMEPDKQWLESRGIDEEDAWRLIRELLERCPRNKRGVTLLNYCRDIIYNGSHLIQDAHKSVPLRKAIEISLREREGRRPQTLRELQYFCRLLSEKQNRLAGMMLRNITSRHCYDALTAITNTPRQFNKGRSILHSIFACGVRHGWCRSNPVAALPKHHLRETEIVPLAWEAIGQLIATAKRPEHRACMPALGIMLWAGVRPAEVERMQWEDIVWEEGVILLGARHSKTGGARCITLHPVLHSWLVKLCGNKKRTGPICPRGWMRRWRLLREASGVRPWQQDVLRHTYASYHLRYFKNLPQLQIEMGHSSLDLLRTRYLNMRGITKENARRFWSPKEWC